MNSEELRSTIQNLVFEFGFRDALIIVLACFQDMMRFSESLESRKMLVRMLMAIIHEWEE